MAAKMLADKTQFCKSIDKADESDWAGKNGYNSGDTIYISKPARFIPTANADITSDIQDVVEEKVALTLNTRKVVPIALTSSEIATDLSLKSWAKRILEPAVSSMAQYIEKDFLQQATQATYQLVGSAGTTVFDTDLSLSAGQKINEMACPDLDGRYALLSPGATRSAVNARKGLFQRSDEIAQQYSKGYMGTADGFDYLTNNLIYTQTNGTDVTGVAVEASVLTPATGATQLGVDGVASGATFTKGMVFTIAGVNAVHPITKQDLGYLQQFTVTANVTETSGNTVTLSISPTIYSSASGSLQNVSALPADEAALVFVGVASQAAQQSLFYHKSAFRMASVPLVLPEGLDMAAQETVDGMTIRVIRDYSVLTDKLILRLDFLGGLAATRPEWAVRATA
jgi:hypothetical protein